MNDLIPLNILYKNSHNGGIGRTWDKHYKDYANYIVNFCGSDIIEIGAGNCRLASNLININKNINEYCIFENTQILLNMGLNKIHFNGILDNDNNKQNNKLYGY